MRLHLPEIGAAILLAALPVIPAVANAQGGASDAFTQGRKLAQSGRCADAIPYFDRAIQANPRYSKAYSDRGRCLAKIGQVARGLTDLDRAVASAPEAMSPYFNRAGLRADAGNADGALGGGGGASGPGCSYSNYAACNAEAAGDRWAAERIEYGRSEPSEQDWYGR
ncbi:MAG TPA: tetratricopeptide repeat protein [Gemmatimonadales bacterium]|jgi:tetratricopeptide (TPR) repeat protein